MVKNRSFSFFSSNIPHRMAMAKIIFVAKIIVLQEPDLKDKERTQLHSSECHLIATQSSSEANFLLGSHIYNGLRDEDIREQSKELSQSPKKSIQKLKQ